jgi:RNA polymerase sigma-70 factor (ECF subfamily)
MTSPSDAQLVEAYRRGDEHAFGALVTRHQAALLRHAQALLGPGSAYEDVVQDVFLKLAEAPPVLGPPAREGSEAVQLAAWLHTVTRNACMDVIRAEMRRKRREREVAADEAVRGGIDAVEHSDTRAAVERELARLSLDQREVLALRLFGDRSYREIAEITGKKVGTVGWLISEGLRCLSSGLAPLVDAASRDGRAARAGAGLAQGEVR